MLVVQSCLTLCNPMDEATRLLCPWNSPGKNTGLHSHSLLQGIFPTQGSNSGLMHCRQILYYLSHQGSPRILEWVAYLFSKGSSQPKNQNQILYCRQIFYQLSYQGSPKKALLSTGILQARYWEWVTTPSSRESSQSRDRTQVSCIAGGFSTI